MALAKRTETVSKRLVSELDEQPIRKPILSQPEPIKQVFNSNQTKQVLPVQIQPIQQKPVEDEPIRQNPIIKQPIQQKPVEVQPKQKPVEDEPIQATAVQFEPKKMALKNIFKPGGFFGKGGAGSKVLAGLGNAAISKITGGTITNVFKTTPAKTAEQMRTDNNAQSLLAGIGSAIGTIKATYQPSQKTIQSEMMAGSAPFSGVNVEKTMNTAGTKSFLAQYWMYILFGVGAAVLLIFKPFKK